MRFLGRVHGTPLRGKVRIYEIHKALTVVPLLIPIERYQLRCFSHVTRMSQEMLARNPADYTHAKAAKRSIKERVESLHYISYLAGVVEPAELLEILLKTVKYFESS